MITRPHSDPMKVVTIDTSSRWFNSYTHSFIADSHEDLDVSREKLLNACG